MPKIKYSPEALRRFSDEMSGISSVVSEIEGSYSNIARAVDHDIRELRGIDGDLRTIERNLESDLASLKRMSAFLEEAAGKYQATAEGLANAVKGGSSMNRQHGGGGRSFAADIKAIDTSVILDRIKNLLLMNPTLFPTTLPMITAPIAENLINKFLDLGPHDGSDFSLSEMISKGLGKAGFAGTLWNVGKDAYKMITGTSSPTYKDTLTLLKDIGTSVAKGHEVGLGGTVSTIASKVKDAFVNKDLGKLALDDDTVTGVKKIFGLNQYIEVDKLSSATSTLGKLGGNFKTAFGSEMNKIFGSVKNGGKVSSKIGAAATVVFNGVENLTDDSMSWGRRIAETVGESAVDIGGMALLTAGIGAAAATAGIAAPAVAVGAAAVGVKYVADVACEHFFGKDATEVVSDFVLDVGEKVVKTKIEMVKTTFNVAKEAGTAAYNFAADTIKDVGQNLKEGLSDFGDGLKRTFGGTFSRLAEIW